MKTFYQYITIRHDCFDDEITVYDRDEWQAMIQTESGKAKLNEYDDFIWQYAENKSQAIEQHDTKLDLWIADVDAGVNANRIY